MNNANNNYKYILQYMIILTMFISVTVYTKYIIIIYIYFLFLLSDLIKLNLEILLIPLFSFV